MQNTVHGSTTSTIGQALSRVDGRAKVTGAAPYAAEAPVKNTAYAVGVQSTIARGRIKSLDTARAQRAPGVLAVITPENMPKLQAPKGASLGEGRMPLSDMGVYHVGQQIALVVADTLERANWAASLVEVTYTEEKPRVSMHDASAPLDFPKSNFGEPLQISKGDATSAAAASGVTVIKATYRTPAETHNPMEMSATTAAWNGEDHLTVWDATQDVTGTRNTIAGLFGLTPANVHLMCPFTGGGFGCKGSYWPHTTMAVVAAQNGKGAR